MNALFRSYGKFLVTVFFGAVLAWGLVLIILPQLAMLESALTKPKRQLDSSIVGSLERDAATCVNILRQYAVPVEPEPENGGLAIPSASGMATPSMSGMASPTLNAGALRPYILQCDRATTHKQMVRDEGRVWLDELHGLPLLSVEADAPIEDQISAAQDIEGMAATLYKALLVEEANAPKLGFSNFAAISKPVLIPRTAAAQAQSDSSLSSKMMTLVGLRYNEGGDSYQRIGLEILTRTLFFAICATLLALVVCYPIAYKVALATPPDRAVWLMLGLIIPYAIVELMRIYAWTAIIDNRGLINELLMWAGAISEPIQFKRSALTVFVVIVYTYVLFMVFPIYNVMSTLDRNQIEAARDLGASTPRLHWRVIIPHSKPGIAVGCIATFMLAAGAFSVPRIISRGLQSEWFSQTIYNKFFESENSNIGAAYSFAYTLVCFLIVALFMWIMRTRLKDFARVQ
jgi:spermidine/putrescine transport system permease protein